jgi:hypothetical protein
MTVERSITAVVALGLALSLGSCGGASEGGFSAYVADHWPHWAGGMPNDVPPRPGAPGYDEFVAHGQAGQDAIKPSSTGTSATAAPTAPVFKTTPSASATTAQVTPAVPETQAEPAPTTEPVPQPSSNDTSVVKGGLY